ncbi:hypothetical protein M8J77_026139 [Diaphorina citri]|nr:hypothetical protein M8J77_026139 [Diaphorina citri]
MEYLLSVDVGTSSVRAALVSTRGKVSPIAVRPIALWCPKPQLYEQSSEDIWNSVCLAIRDVTKDVNPAQIKGVGVDATCSLVALDTNHQPLTISPTGDDSRNVLLWMDHRAVSEADQINATKHSVLDTVGGKISPEMETPKLLWLKKNLPDTCWRRAGLFFDLPDFLTWKLTGDETQSLCSLVCKWTYDAYDRRWNEDYFEKIGLGDLKQNGWRAIGNTVKNPGQPIGHGVSTEVARALGLNPGTPVSVSMIDAHAGALALLATSAPGIPEDIDSKLGLICGTSTCHMALSAKKVQVPGVWGPYYEVILPNTHLLESGQSATGKLLDHIINNHPATQSIMKKLNTEELAPVIQYLNHVIDTRHSTELTADFHVWPDFHGNRSPLADVDMKGMICGLTLDSSETSLVTLYLATIQALAYGTRHIMDAMHAAGKTPAISTLLVSGGLAKNPLYVQTHADVTGCNVLCPQETECMLLGCAMLAAGAGGVYPSVEESMRAMSSQATVVRPVIETARFHDKKYKVFLKLMETQLECRKLMQ